MQDLNPTTRNYARTLDEAFPNDFYAIQRVKRQQWFYGHEPAHTTNSEADFWLYITLAFAAGFMAHMLWGAA